MSLHELALLRRSVSLAGVVTLLAVGAPARAAEEPTASPEGRATLSIRAGIPTDVLANLGDLYSFGAGVEGAFGRQLGRRLILGGVLGYGFGRGSSTAVADTNHYFSAAARCGLGSLDGLSGSLLAGVVWIPRGDKKVVPDLGVSIDWRWLSLGLSVGSVSVGLNVAL